MKYKSILQDICFLVLILIFAAYAQIRQSQDNSTTETANSNPISEDVVYR